MTTRCIFQIAYSSHNYKSNPRLKACCKLASRQMTEVTSQQKAKLPEMLCKILTHLFTITSNCFIILKLTPHQLIREIKTLNTTQWMLESQLTAPGAVADKKAIEMILSVDSIVTFLTKCRAKCKIKLNSQSTELVLQIRGTLFKTQLTKLAV